MVLVGPSGCGKSTLLRMIAGLEDVDTGAIFIGGRDVTDLQPRERDIAMVFQSYALYPHMTRPPEPRLRPQGPAPRQAGDGGARRAGRAAAAARGAARPAAGGALGRAAPARRDGPRDRPRAGGVPDGRAALEPRRQAPRRDAGRAREPARTPRRDDGLRHARPGRGDDAGRPGRGDAGGPDPAGRRAEDALPAAGEPLRRVVHGLARDEPRRGAARRCHARVRRSADRARAGARPGDVEGGDRARDPARVVRGCELRGSVAAAPRRRRDGARGPRLRRAGRLPSRCDAGAHRGAAPRSGRGDAARPRRRQVHRPRRRRDTRPSGRAAPPRGRSGRFPLLRPRHGR